MDTKRYETTGPNIVSQSIDGEVIILSLDKGYYFSLRGSGALIWQSLIESHITMEEVFEVLKSRYEVSEQGMWTVLSSFVDQLISEGLIKQSAGIAEKGSGISTHTGQKTPFIEPVLEKYTDMKDLLFLDPIHEIDPAQGWPKKKES